MAGALTYANYLLILEMTMLRRLCLAVLFADVVAVAIAAPYKQAIIDARSAEKAGRAR